MKITPLTLLATLAVVALAAFLAVFLFTQVFAKQRIQLVEDWKLEVKKWSSWLVLIGVILEGTFEVAPDVLVHVWVMMPDDMKAMLPVPVARCFPIALIALSLPVKIIKQTRLRLSQPPQQEPQNADHHA